MAVMRASGVLLLLCVVLSSTGCRPVAAGGPGDGPLIVVSAPLASQPWIGRSVARGAELAIAQQAGIPARNRLRLQLLDDNASPGTAVANARRAVREHAAALITDGAGALAVSRVTDPASLPVFVVFDGGESFVDARAHPTVFRLAPANKYLSRRLAGYLAARQTPSIALISDDSSYGREGARRSGADVSAQVLAARRSGARAPVLWAGAPDLAQVAGGVSLLRRSLSSQRGGRASSR